MNGETYSRAIRWAPVVLALGTSPALASAEGGGPPSIFAGDLGNIIWTLVTFIAVVIVLGKFAWGPILNALQKREEFIRDSLAGAKRDREEAEARLSELAQKLDAARGEAAAIIDGGRKDADALRRRLEQDARHEAEVITDRAKREINLARDTAVKELYDLTATLATEVAAKIIRKEMDAAQHQRLIAEAIEELAQSGGSGQN